MLYRWEDCDLAGPMLPGYEDRKIADTYAERPALPVDVFSFAQPETWVDRIWELMADVITPEVKTNFMQNPPEYVVSDDLSWLDERVLEGTGKIVDTKQLLADRLGANYRAFRAAHATRTDDLAPFYTVGLRCLKAGEAEDRARVLFLNGKFKWADEARLQSAIKELNARDLAGGREGRIYFCADERNLYTRQGSAGHYLVYGSEYLYCLGMRVAGTGNTQDVLKSIGRPTMIVCDIPVNELGPYTLSSFAGLIWAYMFCGLVPQMECSVLQPWSGSALSIDSDLAAEHIVGHYHPREVHSPL